MKKRNEEKWKKNGRRRSEERVCERVGRKRLARREEQENGKRPRAKNSKRRSPFQGSETVWPCQFVTLLRPVGKVESGNQASSFILLF